MLAENHMMNKQRNDQTKLLMTLTSAPKDGSDVLIKWGEGVISMGCSGKACPGLSDLI